jgi:hypothetical protein
MTHPIEYENRVIQDIIANIESPTAGTILATSLLANIKRTRGDFSTMHWQAAQRMIAINGGLRSLHHDPLVFTKHTWTAIALSGTSFGFPDQPIDGQGHGELNKLLSSRWSTTLKALPTSQSYVEQEDNCARTRVFKAQSELRKLLSSASESSESGSSSPSIKASCRIAIILFITSAMRDCGDFSRATELYLAAVAEHLDGKKDDSALCPEHLLWSLIRLSFLHANSTKCIEHWMAVVRMSTAWKQLQMVERQSIEALLWASLELPETVDSVTMLTLPKTVTAISTPWQMSARTVPKDCFCELLWFTVPI